MTVCCFSLPKNVCLVIVFVCFRKFYFMTSSSILRILLKPQLNFILFNFNFSFLAHLAFRPCELLSSLFVRRPSVNISHFNLLLRNHWANCNQTLVEWSWMAPFQNCVRRSRLPTKMAAKLKIEKRGDEILIVCCFSVSQNELKF